MNSPDVQYWRERALLGSKSFAYKKAKHVISLERSGEQIKQGRFKSLQRSGPVDNAKTAYYSNSAMLARLHYMI